MKKPRIHREGRTLICGTALLLFLVNVPMFLYFPHWIFGITLSLTALLLVFVTYFFRNPVRVVEIDDPNFIIAPADGRVVVVEPMEENEYFLHVALQCACELVSNRGNDSRERASERSSQRRMVAEVEHGERAFTRGHRDAIESADRRSSGGGRHGSSHRDVREAGPSGTPQHAPRVHQTRFARRYVPAAEYGDVRRGG